MATKQGNEDFGGQPRPTLIFKGKGNVQAKEQKFYDERVYVMFQKKAWLDTEAALQWDNDVFKPHVEERAAKEGTTPRILAFMDNVTSQANSRFLNALKSHNTSRCLLKPNETEALQPIDAGLAALYKLYIGQEQEKWLLDDINNFDIWNNPMSAKTKRILLTTWVGNAHSRICAEKQEAIFKCFVKTGCGITIDQSDDNHIKPLKDVNYNCSDYWEKWQVKDAIYDSINKIQGPNVLSPALDYGPTACIDAEEVDDDDIDDAPAQDDNNGYVCSPDDMDETLNDDHITEDSWNNCIKFLKAEFNCNAFLETRPKRLAGFVALHLVPESREWDVIHFGTYSISKNVYRVKSLITGVVIEDFAVSPTEAEYGKDFGFVVAKTSKF
jgi:hypothetical protein